MITDKLKGDKVQDTENKLYVLASAYYTVVSRQTILCSSYVCSKVLFSTFLFISILYSLCVDPPGCASPHGVTAPSTTEDYLLVSHIEDYTCN